VPQVRVRQQPQLGSEGLRRVEQPAQLAFGIAQEARQWRDTLAASNRASKELLRYTTVADGNCRLNRLALGSCARVSSGISQAYRSIA